VSEGGVVLEATGLPSAPLDAAAHFHAELVPTIRRSFGKAANVVIVLRLADHAHDAWRLAAIQELAREAAPCRVNAVVGSAGDPDGTGEAIAFLHDSPGITGQILKVGGKSGAVA